MVAAFDAGAVGLAPEPAAKRAKVEELPSLELRTYQPQRILGQGSFGRVYQAKVLETGDTVAIKSIQVVGLSEITWRHHDGKLDGNKDREVQILKELNGHPNIVCLKGAFLSGVGTKYANLNLVMEFMSDTLQRVVKHYNQLNKRMEQYYVKLYQYQLLRGLAWMHTKCIMHVDIKPQNLLLDGGTHALKICDFGTAKRVNLGMTQAIAYACSRYYRAPELILGMMEYTTSVDIWSAGCVFAELMLGQPLFTGLDGIDHFVEMVKVLGTPSTQELQAMNPNYPAYDFGPGLAPITWDKVLRGLASRDAIELAAGLVTWDPAARILPLHAMGYRFFDALRSDERPEHRSLFTFQEGELDWFTVRERERLVPRWMSTKADIAIKAENK